MHGTGSVNSFRKSALIQKPLAQIPKAFHQHDIHIVPLKIWHQLFLEFWLVDARFFAHPRDQQTVTRLENVRR